MNIREIRKQKNLTQKELAFKLHTNANNISRYETGERKPSITTAQALAKALGCTIDDLLKEEDMKKE